MNCDLPLDRCIAPRRTALISIYLLSTGSSHLGCAIPRAAIAEISIPRALNYGIGLLAKSICNPKILFQGFNYYAIFRQ